MRIKLNPFRLESITNEVIKAMLCKEPLPSILDDLSEMELNTLRNELFFLESDLIPLIALISEQLEKEPR